MIVRHADQHSAIAIPPSAHTLPGFRQWVMSNEFPQHGRVSLIDGEVVIDMGPKRVQSHTAPKTEITLTVGLLVRELDLGKLLMDGAWITNDQAGLSNEPDAVFARWETLRSGELQIVPSAANDDDGVQLQGSPDWALEVVSASSVQKDTQYLVRAYHRAQLDEYWVVDARGDEIQFTIYFWAPDGYQAAPPANGWLTSRVFGRQFRFDRRRDQVGLREYTLHHRESPEIDS